MQPAMKHIRIIDLLRGVAALGVVLLHFGDGGLPTTRHNPLSDLFNYGQYGVHIFFVISGFIIPYSLHLGGYTINDFFGPVIKRVIRIIPPAYISIALIFSLNLGAMLINGRAIEGRPWVWNELLPVFANFSLTANYFHVTWYNPVFWTLAIEFQYYLLIGLLYPVLINSKQPVIAIVLLLLLAGHWLPFFSFFSFASFFVMGILVFLEREKRISTRAFYTLLTACIIAGIENRGPAECLFATAAAFSIRHLDVATRFTSWLGRISFSLYLTHFFTGWITEIIIRKFVFVPSTGAEKLVMVFVYVGTALLAADIFYRLVERPFLTLSKKKMDLPFRSSESRRPALVRENLGNEIAV
jgi:peptidoglycan/LPS O-acetylase OafA/YrhL